MNVREILMQSADTYDERNAIYGDTYKDIGDVLDIMVLNPDLNTPQDHNRFRLFSDVVSKLMRYAAQFNNGGHADSLHDAITYAAMLSETDAADWEVVADAADHAPEENLGEVETAFEQAMGEEIAQAVAEGWTIDENGAMMPPADMQPPIENIDPAVAVATGLAPAPLSPEERLANAVRDNVGRGFLGNQGFRGGVDPLSDL